MLESGSVGSGPISTKKKLLAGVNHTATNKKVLQTITQLRRDQKLYSPSYGFGSKKFDLGWAGSIFCCSGRVGSAIFGLGLENFP